jgi:nucleotide-binding universal stress UspA family protein
MNIEIDSILIPTDYSDLSESALEVGIAIAKRQNAEVTILNVVDRFSSFPPARGFSADFRMTPNIFSTAGEKMQELTEIIFSKTGKKVSGKILEGNPSDLICQFAFEENISFIVMGTHGISGIREFFMGSETYRVVKNASCPVLTIPGNWDKINFEKVLFPVRLLPGMLTKYYYSSPIIEKNQSELFLLGLSELDYSGDIKKISVLMDKIKKQLHNDNVVFQTAICKSKDFPEETIKISKEYDIDLICLMANFDNDFIPHYLGPYAQQVLNHAHLPILSIKST